MNILFEENKTFQSYSSQHFWPLLIIGVLGLIAIIKARKYLDRQNQKQLLLLISLIPFLGTVIVYPIAFYENNFLIKEDLPLHLCRFLSITAPFVVWKESRFWIGIFYFWILVGTLNAAITPDVEFGFPHWSYFAYWMTHGTLIIIPFYYIFVFQLRITRKDLITSYVMTNVFLFATLCINLLLGSNYMYTREKPPVASLLDILGPWPEYLITGQALVIALFVLVYLPFWIAEKLQKKST